MPTCASRPFKARTNRLVPARVTWGAIEHAGQRVQASFHWPLGPLDEGAAFEGQVLELSCRYIEARQIESERKMKSPVCCLARWYKREGSRKMIDCLYRKA